MGQSLGTSMFYKPQGDSNVQPEGRTSALRISEQQKWCENHLSFGYQHLTIVSMLGMAASRLYFSAGDSNFPQVTIITLVGIMDYTTATTR